jgi:hypothetical protein
LDKLYEINVPAQLSGVEAPNFVAGDIPRSSSRIGKFVPDAMQIVGVSVPGSSRA